VSANLFDVLGVGPARGRAFREGEEQPARRRVVILSHGFWQQHYNAASDAIGKRLRLDETDYEVIGVMPEGFEYPAAGTSLGIPWRLDPRVVGEYWGSGGLSAVARIRAGTSRTSAQAELRAWMPRIRGMFPWRMPDAWGAGGVLEPLREHLVAGAR